MCNNQLSDLAKSILAGDRIEPLPTEPISSSIPKGATLITESTQPLGMKNHSMPDGAKTVNFTKENED